MKRAIAACLAAGAIAACVPGLPSGALGGPNGGSGGRAAAAGTGGLGGAPPASGGGPPATGTGATAGPDASAGGAAGPTWDQYVFVDDVSMPQNLAVDSRYVYWLDFDRSSVMRAPTAGGLPVPVSVANYPQGGDWIALDSRNVYWSLSMKGIYTAPIDGGAPSAIVPFTVSQRTIWKFAANEDGLFWIEDVGVDESLMKVGHDGGPSTQLATIRSATAIAVDDQYVYWAGVPTTGGCTTLDCQSINKLAVSGGEPVVLAPSGGVPTILALDATHVYWLNDAHGVMRIAKDGGPPELVPGPVDAQSFAVDASGIYWSDQRGSIFASTPGASDARIVVKGAGESATGLALGTDSVYWLGGGQFHRRMYGAPK